WTGAHWAVRDSRSPSRALDAWGCRSSTGPQMRTRRSRPSTVTSTSAAPSSTPRTCTGLSPTRSSSAARCASVATG
ncbi:MAG: Oxidoreductase, aldo/keto reductase family, partial [uncultured Solirubrobacterales bacterium]